MIYPAFFGKLLLSYKAIKSWTQLHLSGEGAPIPWEAVACIAEIVKDGSQARDTTSEMVLRSADCYLRESAWQSVHRKDVVERQEHCLRLFLGIGDKGDGTKTGTRQCVRPDRYAVAQSLRARRDRTRPGHKMFNVSAPE